MTQKTFAGITPQMLETAIAVLYDITPMALVTPLKYSENLTFSVVDPDRGKKYVLRVFRPEYHKPSEMEGEVLWIHEITRQSDVKTADVIPGRNGKFIQHIDGYYLALFEFIKGTEVSDLAPEALIDVMERIGEIAAKLHRQVQSWPEAAHLDRFSWDIRDILSRESRWGHYSSCTTLSQKELQLLDAASQIIEMRLETFGRTPDRYGLIHSDLNIHNLLFHKNEVYVLDFDDCGYGWFLYDLATAAMVYFGETRDLVLAALVRGYEKIRPLSIEEKEILPTLCIARKILRIGWITSHSDNDTVKGISADYLQQTLEEVRQFLTKENM